MLPSESPAGSAHTLGEQLTGATLEGVLLARIPTLRYFPGLAARRKSDTMVWVTGTVFLWITVPSALVTDEVLALSVAELRKRAKASSSVKVEPLLLLPPTEQGAVRLGCDLLANAGKGVILSLFGFRDLFWSTMPVTETGCLT